MGLFDDQSADVESIVVGFNVPAGDYEFEITGVELKSFSEGKLAEQQALIVELTVVNECDEEGMTFDHFLVIPNERKQDNKAVRRNRGNLKGALLWYGIPESRLNAWDPTDEDHKDMIIGKRGLGVLKQNGAFTNLTSFQLTEESGVSNTEVSAVAGADLASGWAN